MSPAPSPLHHLRFCRRHSGCFRATHRQVTVGPGSWQPLRSRVVRAGLCRSRPTRSASCRFGCCSLGGKLTQELQWRPCPSLSPSRARPHLSVCTRHWGQARPSLSLHRPASLTVLWRRPRSVRAGAFFRAPERSWHMESESLQWYSLWSKARGSVCRPLGHLVVAQLCKLLASWGAEGQSGEVLAPQGPPSFVTTPMVTCWTTLHSP